jgi:Fe-S-cluster-containing hydrogenase component 2
MVASSALPVRDVQRVMRASEHHRGSDSGDLMPVRDVQRGLSAAACPRCAARPVLCAMCSAACPMRDVQRGLAYARCAARPGLCAICSAACPMGDVQRGLRARGRHASHRGCEHSRVRQRGSTTCWTSCRGRSSFLAAAVLLVDRRVPDLRGALRRIATLLRARLDMVRLPLLLACVLGFASSRHTLETAHHVPR